MIEPTTTKAPITIPAIAPPLREDCSPTPTELVTAAGATVGLAVGVTVVPGFETTMVVGWPETVTTETIGDAVVVEAVETYAE